MNWLNPILILLTAFVAIFLEASFQGVRHMLGVQIDLLPALMVYTSLSSGFGMVVALALAGGFWFDSLSANPLGISTLPLLLIGTLIYARRSLILREQRFAQLVLGLTASALMPMLTLLLLLSTRQTPLVGWGSLWQWFVMSVGGALLTPACFRLFDGLNRALSYRPIIESSFRPDREIRRSHK